MKQEIMIICKTIKNMKTFTHQELYNCKECYNENDFYALSFMTEDVIHKNKLVTIEQIFNSEISLKHKMYFLLRNFQLSLKQKKQLLIDCVSILLLTNNKYHWYKVESLYYKVYKRYAQAIEGGDFKNNNTQSANDYDAAEILDKANVIISNRDIEKLIKLFIKTANKTKD